MEKLNGVKKGQRINGERIKKGKKQEEQEKSRSKKSDKLTLLLVRAVLSIYDPPAAGRHAL